MPTFNYTYTYTSASVPTPVLFEDLTCEAQKVILKYFTDESSAKESFYKKLGLEDSDVEELRGTLLKGCHCNQPFEGKSNRGLDEDPRKLTWYVVVTCTSEILKGRLIREELECFNKMVENLQDLPLNMEIQLFRVLVEREKTETLRNWMRNFGKAQELLIYYILKHSADENHLGEYTRVFLMENSDILQMIQEKVDGFKDTHVGKTCQSFLEFIRTLVKFGDSSMCKSPQSPEMIALTEKFLSSPITERKDVRSRFSGWSEKDFPNCLLGLQIN